MLSCNVWAAEIRMHGFIIVIWNECQNKASQRRKQIFAWCFVSCQSYLQLVHMASKSVEPSWQKPLQAYLCFLGEEAWGCGAGEKDLYKIQLALRVCGPGGKPWPAGSCPAALCQNRLAVRPGPSAAGHRAAVSRTAVWLLCARPDVSLHRWSN